jgi:peptidyl-prolyl cis-trans isomerase C
MNKRALATGAAAFLLSTVILSQRGAQAQPERDPNQVVVRVGTSAITVGEFERRMAKLPRFQLATFGNTPQEIRHAFLQKVLIPEYLFAQAAKESELDNDVDVRGRTRDVLKSATLRELRDKGASQSPPAEQEVRAYYEAHKTQYDSPGRYAIWRILVAGKEEAAALIAQARKDPTPKTWNELARNKSLDKSTNQRGGNLGFVTEAGDSSDGKIKVAPAIITAVKAVKDGELVDQPVQEGSGWAVVWRRSSVPEVHRSLREEEANIRRQIAQEKSQTQQEKVLAGLREHEVHDVNASVLDLIEISSTGQLGARGKPGRVVRKPSAGPPENTPRGLR